MRPTEVREEARALEQEIRRNPRRGIALLAGFLFILVTGMWLGGFFGELGRQTAASEEQRQLAVDVGSKGGEPQKALPSSSSGPAGGTANDTIAPAEVEAFWVEYRKDSGPLREREGVLDGIRDWASTSDRLIVEARFEEPSWACLMSLDTDGVVRLRLPATAEEEPRARDRIAFPEGADFFLATEPTTQGFVLLSSSGPLPAFSELELLDGMRWDPPELERGLEFDGIRFRELGNSRNKVVDDEGVPDACEDLVQAMRDAQPDLEIRAIFFDVRPKTP